MDELIRIAGYAHDSVVDGAGIRFTVFFQGCGHKCKGCHNLSTHAFDGGVAVSQEVLLKKIIDDCPTRLVTFSGGDPLYQACSILPVVKKLREQGFNIWVFTGFVWEDIYGKDDDKTKVLHYVDVLVDGKYEEELKSYDLVFCGSSNQRLIDARKTISDVQHDHKIILWSPVKKY